MYQKNQMARIIEVAHLIHSQPRKWTRPRLTERFGVNKMSEIDETHPYNDALLFWGYKQNVGDLKLVKALWEEMIENGEHITPIEYIDVPIDIPNPDDLFPLEHHVFCAENLSEEEIEQHVEEDLNNENNSVLHDFFIYHW